MSEMVITCVNGSYILRDERSEHVLTLSVGQDFEVLIRGEWCQVRLESGGYNGRYYVTTDSERGRLALCMKARMCQQVPVQEAVAMTLEQAQAFWIGKQVESRVLLACGRVHGVVHDITQGGSVLFVYTPHFNEVPVVVTFPLERIRDVLAVGHAVA